MHATTLSPRDDIVTASDLVRRFGHWGERALTTPLYIFHRGQPRLILTSIELIDMLARSHRHAAIDERDRVAALLDGSPGMIVIVDAALTIIAASRPVRTRFGERAAPGSAVTGLVAVDRADAFITTIERVVTSGLAETVETALAIDPGRPIWLAVEPHPDGVALFGRTDPADDRASLDETFVVSRGAAVARLDRFGFLDGPHTALAALTGIDPPTLSSLRFVSLFTIESRAGVSGLIAAVEDDGQPRSGTARMLIDSGDPRPVSIAFAARRRGTTIEGVVALILATN